jgi:hypothetical protein
MSSSSEDKREVYVNGLINLSLIPKDEYDSFIKELDSQINNYYKNTTLNNQTK